MVSCVLPSRIAWPLDRQTSRNWAREDPEVARVGREAYPQSARCRQGTKAEILIDFINLSPINLGRHMRAAARPPFPCPRPGLPTLATLETAGVAPWAMDCNNSCAATCRLGHGCFLFQLGRDQRNTAGTSTTLLDTARP